MVFVLFFKQKTAYEMRISDWSSDVCSSDLERAFQLCAGTSHHQGYQLRGAGGPQCGHRRSLGGGQVHHFAASVSLLRREDRKSVVSGKSVSVRVDLGGRRIILTKK